MEEPDRKRRIISKDTILYTKWPHRNRPIDEEAWRIYTANLARELKARGLPPFRRG